jgi:hypothetical protein
MHFLSIVQTIGYVYRMGITHASDMAKPDRMTATITPTTTVRATAPQQQKTTRIDYNDSDNHMRCDHHYCLHMVGASIFGAVETEHGRGTWVGSGLVAYLLYTLCSY